MSFEPSIRPVGDRALLLELEDNDAVHAVSAALRGRFGAELADVVPGHRTVLLAWHESHPSVGAVMSFLELFAESASGSTRGTDAAAAGGAAPVAIEVAYHGADLDAVAVALGVSVERVIELHCAPEYRVAFVGFMPGFPYLVGAGASDTPLLELPRLSVPRTEVPAGSVAVAAGYCGIYPRASPGGWNLLGHTEALLFDPERDPPALLAPGMRVRFEPR